MQDLYLNSFILVSMLEYKKASSYLLAYSMFISCSCSINSLITLGTQCFLCLKSSHEPVQIRDDTVLDSVLKSKYHLLKGFTFSNTY